MKLTTRALILSTAVNAAIIGAFILAASAIIYADELDEKDPYSYPPEHSYCNTELFVAGNTCQNVVPEQLASCINEALTGTGCEQATIQDDGNCESCLPDYEIINPTDWID